LIPDPSATATIAMAASQSAAADNAVRVLTKEQNLQAEALENRTRKPATNAMAERLNAAVVHAVKAHTKERNQQTAALENRTRKPATNAMAERLNAAAVHAVKALTKERNQQAEVPENHTRKRAVNGDQTPKQVVLVAFRRRVKNPGAHLNPGGTGPWTSVTGAMAAPLPEGHSAKATETNNMSHQIPKTTAWCA
jgi:hypothetical protein